MKNDKKMEEDTEAAGGVAGDTEDESWMFKTFSRVNVTS